MNLAYYIGCPHRAVNLATTTLNYESGFVNNTCNHNSNQ